MFGAGYQSLDNPELQAQLLAKFKALLDWAGDPTNPEWRCLTQADYDQLAGLNYGLLQNCWVPYEAYYNEYLKDKEKAGAKKQAWVDELNKQEAEDGAPMKICMLFNKVKDEPKCRPKKIKIGEDTHSGVWIPDKYAPLVGKCLMKYKLDFDAKWEAEHNPVKAPAPKKSSGTRLKKGEFDGVVEVAVTKAEALEDEHKFKYYFGGDEGLTFEKGTLNKDKSKKTMRHKCVASKRYLGGVNSKDNDGYCCGAVKWELAGGSQAIADTGMSTSQFRIRCGSSAVSGSRYCQGCSNKSNPDFFTGTYAITKGNAVKFDGIHFVDFIAENLDEKQR